MSLWQVNCFEILLEVWGQTFKMIILTYIFLYSGVFLHLKSTKQFIPLFYFLWTTIQYRWTNPWWNHFPFSFHSAVYIWAMYGEENCTATKSCIHNVIKLEIQPVKSSIWLFRLKAEKATSKNQQTTFFPV